MDPVTMMWVLGIALPVAALLAFCVPAYLGIWAGLYWVYEARGKANPMPALKYETSIVWDQFQIHLAHWQAHADALPLMGFTVPLFLPTIIGVLTGAGMLYLVVMYAINIFRVTD